MHHASMRGSRPSCGLLVAAATLMIGAASAALAASRLRNSRPGPVWADVSGAAPGPRRAERPYEASITVVRRAHTRALVMRVHSAADGRFTAFLAPGTYLLVPRNGRPFPRARSQTVSVHRASFTLVTIRYDSGIR